ncbi:hypothetical protein HDU76_000665 [Blyttiomyces sp. JEL0837]|nr:hypothetical protein HDU76_000665 [Blyttiomyces sp. JEL0837]
MKAESFVAGYVRKVASEESKRNLVDEKLKWNVPFVEETCGAVALLDISGFTALTSTLLAKRGRRSSEEMTQLVSGFMCKVMDILFAYNGDVVKFLGDALLVVFEAEGKDEVQLRLATRRAVACCAEVLQKSKKKFLDKEVRQMEEKEKSRRKSSQMNEDLLSLHIGVSAGTFSHVIIGVKGERCDYFVQGPCLGEIGGPLDEARPGELAMTCAAWNLVSAGEAVNINSLKTRRGEKDSLICEAVSLDKLHQAVNEALNPGGTSETTTPRIGASRKLPPPEIEDSPDPDMIQFCYQFMNQSLAHKLRTINANHDVRKSRTSRVPSFTDSTASEDSASSSIPQPSPVFNTSTKLQTLAETESSSTSSLSPVSNGATSPSLAPTSASTALLPSPTSGQSELKPVTPTVRATPTSEYRRVAVMFIKFSFPYDGWKAQKIFATLVKGLKPFDGVIQQFSVDDKGQSFLSVFGLPPWSHENNSLYALKAAMAVSDNLRSFSLVPFTIGLASGDILFSHMGSPQRSEAALLGDVVNVAARLMSISKEGCDVLCDNETHVGTAEIYTHNSLGLQQLKGKLEPVSVFSIHKQKQTKARRGVDSGAKQKRTFGYKKEYDQIQSTITEWTKTGEPSLLILEAPSGMGKTYLVRTLQKITPPEVATTCHINGSEIEQCTPYYPIEDLLQSLLKCIKSSPIWETSPVSAQFKKSAASKATGDRATVGRTSGTVSAGSRSLNYRRVRSSFGPDLSMELSSENLTDVIPQFLAICGINPDFAPLLRPFFPWMPESRQEGELANLDAQARNTLLRLLLVDIVVAVSEATKLIVLCDDVQVWMFRDLGARSISKQILQAIHRRSCGSPLYLERLADTLLEHIPPVLLCDEFGTISVDESSGNAEDILVGDVQSAILVSFDQLNPQFQEFLRVASVFGQYFDAEEVSGVMDEGITTRDLTEMIEEYDRFTYLESMTPSDTLREQNNDPTLERPKIYRFSHVMICNAIYESQAFARRRDTHLKIALFLESLLIDENRNKLLPSIAYHFGRTTHRQKIYRYLEELALDYMDRFLVAEGSASLEHLIKFYEGDSEAAKDPELTGLRVAVWYKLLGVALAGRGNFTQSRQNILKALYLVGIDWPDTDAQYEQSIMNSTKLQKTLWLRTLGGRIPTRFLQNATENVCKIVFACVQTLRDIVSFDITISRQEIPMITVTFLNYTIVHGKRFRAQFVLACFRAAQWYWLNNQRNWSNIYLQQARKFFPYVTGIELHFVSAAHLFIYKGDFKVALRFLRLSAEKSIKVGDLGTFRMAQLFMASSYISLGKLNEARRMLEEQLPALLNNEEHGLTLVFSSLLMVIAIFTNSQERIQEQRQIIAADKSGTSQVFIGASLASMTLYYLYARDPVKALKSFRQFADNASKMPVNQILPLQLVGQLTIIPFIFLSEGYYSKWKQEDATAELKEFNLSVTLIADQLYRIWRIPYVEGAIAYRLYTAAELLIKDDIKGGLAIIKKGISDRLAPEKALMGSKSLIHGLHKGIIGRFSTEAAERNAYKAEGIAILRGIGAECLASWVEGNPFGMSQES